MFQSSHGFSPVATASYIQTHDGYSVVSIQPRIFTRGDIWSIPAFSVNVNQFQSSHGFSPVATAGPSTRRRKRVTFESPLLGTPKIKSHELALRSVWRPCPAENLGSLPPSSAYGMRCHHLTARKPPLLKGLPSPAAIRQLWPSVRAGLPIFPGT